MKFLKSYSIIRIIILIVIDVTCIYIEDHVSSILFTVYIQHNTCVVNTFNTSYLEYLVFVLLFLSFGNELRLRLSTKNFEMLLTPRLLLPRVSSSQTNATRAIRVVRPIVS